MFAQLRAPSTFDYVVPSVHFERRVDLFSSFVAPKAAQHRNAMENEKLVQEVFGRISSRLRVLFAGMRLELREQKCALFPKGFFALNFPTSGQCGRLGFAIRSFTRLTFRERANQQACLLNYLRCIRLALIQTRNSPRYPKACE